MTEERKYSVREIDDLRQAVRNHYLFGRYSGPRSSGMSRTYYEAEMAKVVEEQVRTHVSRTHRK